MLLACLALRRKRWAQNRHCLLVAWMALHAMDLALLWHCICTRHFLRRKDLVPVHASPWAHLKAIHEDHSALQVMGITLDAFNHLHSFFKLILEKLQLSLQ